jgi:transposase
VDTKLRADKMLRGGVHMQKKTRKKYTDEFKGEAVRLVTEQGYKTTEAARNLGIHDGVLRRWIKDRSPEVAHASPSTLKLQAELKLVKRENERLRMEREILKKAAAFFAKESV